VAPEPLCLRGGRVLADSQRPSESVVVTRKGEGRTVEKMKGFSIEYLVQTDSFEMLKVRVEPGGITQMLTHEGEESHLVMSGELEVAVDSKTFLLREGDSIWYRSSSPHRWRNASGRDVLVYSIAFPRTYASLLMQELEGPTGACPSA
jgi:quercetin dioxygenase-like cupin family protein